MSVEIQVTSEQETDSLGRALAKLLPDGAVVALIGTLGAGKTRLVQSVAEASGVPKEDIGSPTFVLVKEYDGVERSIYHFDAYRLNSTREFVALGADEYFDGNGVSFVEWADRVEEALPTSRLEIRIEPLDSSSRKFTFTARGDFDPDFENSLQATWRPAQN